MPPTLRTLATNATLALLSSVVFCGSLASAAVKDNGIAIVNATVFDATGAAPSVRTVLIKDGRIAAIGLNLTVPAGFTTIDATGEALLPGFFDLHTHWTAGGLPNTIPAMAYQDVAAGVTTANDFNSAPESFAAKRAWVATLVAPHVNFCGRLSTPGGHGADWADTATTKQIVTPEGARIAIDQIMPYKPDCFGEVMTDGWRYGTAPDDTSMNADAIAALVDEAHKYHLPVLTHTVTVTKGREAGQAHVDVIAHALQDRAIDDATIAAIKQGGGTFAPTLAVYDPNKAAGHSTAPPNASATDPRMVKWQFALANTKRLYDAGIPITLGTDAGMPGTPHGKSTLREMELLVQAGLTQEAALIAATANSARAMGELADRGTIEAGKRADLVLVKGKPWQTIADVENTDRVFIDGRVVFGAGAPAPNADIPMPAEKVGELIDDFERADGRSNLDTLVVTAPDGGIDRTTEIIQLVPRDGSTKALFMTANMAMKDKPFASVIVPLTKGGIAPADLRSYKGIHLDLRGDGIYEVQLNSINGAWTSTVIGTSEWKTIELPFTALHPVVRSAAAKQQATWKGNDITEIEVIVRRDAGAKTWLELDNISFF